MDVVFDDPKLQRIAENSSKLVRKFGPTGAKRIQSRLAQLRAVDTVVDLLPLPGNWHGLEADRSEQWAGDLEHPKRIVVRPTTPAPRKPDGGVDWAAVRSVTIVEFVDYH